ncbi:MAG: hypothetical protein R3A13_02635 [Bdellovibrionota bacterium]
MTTGFIQSRHSKPEPQAWLLAGLALILFICAAYYSVLAGTYLYHTTASKMLLNELDAGRFGGARALLKRCITRPPFSSLLIFSQSNARDSAEQFKGSISQHLYDALVYLDIEEVEKAAEELNKVDPNSIIPNLAVLREDVEVEGPHRRIDNLLAARKAAVSAKHQIQTLTSELSASLDKHMKTSRNFADFFSLDSAYKDFPNSSAPLTYKNGVLKDLPQLRALPDGIEDLAVLRNKLNSIGGRVRTSELDAAAEYHRKIGALKDKSLAEVYEFNRITERLSNASALESSLTAKYNSERRLLAETLKQIIKLRAEEAYFKHLDPPFWLRELVA